MKTKRILTSIGIIFYLTNCQTPHVPEGMILIPAGNFMMGNKSGQKIEMPADLSIDDMDIYEVNWRSSENLRRLQTTLPTLKKMEEVLYSMAKTL